MSELMGLKMSAVKSESVAWLWPGRIPRGKVTLLAGDPGLGKSFVTTDIAARVTRAGTEGGHWPDGPTPLRAPGDVIFFNAEDDVADTLKPRVEAAGGHVDRVHFIEGIDRDDEREQGYFEIDRDCRALSSYLGKLTSPRLVIIDPISAFMGGVDTHRNSDVRAALARLGRVASTHNVAIVCVTHLSKSQEGQSKKAVHRLMGSLAFAAAARMVWMIGKHPDDAERRVMTLVKSNLEACRTGLSYKIGRAGEGRSSPQQGSTLQGGRETHGAHGPHGAQGGQSARVLWDESAYTGSADALEDAALAEQESAMDEAERFLREVLRDGPVAAAEVMRQAKEAGVSEGTLKRAKRRVGVDAEKGAGVAGPWNWRLS